ncbi:MAG: hypothetical protein Q9163_003822 [Psora crenata]
MDPFSQTPQIDTTKLTDADKRELQQTLGNEMQKAKIQEAVHTLTDLCWTKCVTGTIRSAQLDRGEAACTQNCVERFLDANEVVLGHLQKLQGGGKM